MADEENRDWLLPAILIGLVVIGIAAFVGGYLLGRDSSTEPMTVGDRLEAWSGCLREAGADVPQVEARGDGGFTITFDGSFLEEPFEPGTLLPALAACQHVAPDLGFLGPILQFAPFGDQTFDPFSGEGFRIPPELRDRFRDRPLEEICDRLADADRLPEDNEDIHRLLLRCGLIDG